MSSYNCFSVNTVDSHTEGNPTRVIVGGVPVPPGKSLQEQAAWLRQHNDGLRRMLNFEPGFRTHVLCAGASPFFSRG